MLGMKMPFPESERVVYGENPLVEVICQLKFPPILDISKAVPADFQKKVRKLYPLYEEDTEPSLPELPSHIPQEALKLAAQFLQDGSRTHRFLTDDGLRVIALTKDFVAVTDRAYLTWEKFRKDIDLVMEAVEEVYEPAFYSRVGLRYRNVIDREQLGLQREPWDALLSKELIGSLMSAKKLRDNVRHVLTVAVISIDEVTGGFVRLRHGLVNRPQEGEGQMYVIDADFYSEEREATKNVVATVDRFNGLAGQLFRWAIKKRLHEALRPS